MQFPLNVARLGVALRSPSEEFAATVTHGLGCLLSCFASLLLMSRTLASDDPWLQLGCGFYCVSLIGLYATSALSHMYMTEEWNRFFRRLDQGFIYLLIVGTFTPYVAAYFETTFWLSFYALILSVAVGGFVSKIFFSHRLNGGSVWLCLVLGWSQAFALSQLWGLLSAPELGWLVAGGLLYTIGTIFFVLDIRRYHFHAVWHVFVMLGSGCHFLSIYHCVSRAA